ncbi:efflux RND transporter periplasmic adaptor subunit [candidate division KSB1 bacterium]|nr:efflux RND transporter periplasmic adaptor subunit [candidate division KSB1 bacterium]
MKKKVIIGVVIILVALAIYFLFFNKKAEAFTFRFEKVTRGEITVMVTATGTLNAVTTVEVGSQVSGTISNIYADFNSIVNSGQLVAQIDPTPWVQALHDAEASLERVTAQYNEARRALARITPLYEKRLESQATYDAATTNAEVSKAALKQSQAQLERARINLSYTNIYAPVNGVVIDRKINVGQTVAANFSAPTLFTIANDLRKMQVEATVDESDIGKITVGQTVTFSVDAYTDYEFSGQVTQIRLAPVIIQNVVNYTVVISVLNENLMLMPGMTANVKILIAKKSDVLKIPNIALRFQPPTELIDPKMQEKMKAGWAHGDRDRTVNNPGPATPQNAAPGTPAGTQNPTTAKADKKSRPPQMDENPAGQRMSNQPAPGFDPSRFRALRDSIQAVHGNKLAPEELRAEVRKVLQRRNPTERVAPEPARSEITAPGTPYKIIQKFPQYQKSAVLTLTKEGHGRIWILNEKGQLESLPVRTGLNDGRNTEIMTDKLAEGQEIVVGAFSNANQTAKNNSPLTTPGPMPMGGRMR